MRDDLPLAINISVHLHHHASTQAVDLLFLRFTKVIKIAQVRKHIPICRKLADRETQGGGAFAGLQRGSLANIRGLR